MRHRLLRQKKQDVSGKVESFAEEEVSNGDRGQMTEERRFSRRTF